MAQDSSTSSLINTYHELNAAVVDELSRVPAPLDFMRYVAKNRPFIVRHGAKDWTAVRNWNSQYLRNVMEGKKVKVAITPFGNADAVIESERGLTFVEPYEVDEDFSSFLDYVQKDSISRDDYQIPNVKYAQTQNDNLRDEYQALFSDVPPTVSFASEALQQTPDAVNFWLGNHRSTTALHKDNYENIYVQIRGQKHFTLLPPVEMPCVNETPVPRARYRPSAEDEGRLAVEVDNEAKAFPVPVWDPDEPEKHPTSYSPLSKSLKVRLNEGDMMYLPAMWYHKVSQSIGEEGFSCSVNYWYDMDFGGSFWASNAFLRDVVSANAKAVIYPPLEMTERAPPTEKE